MSAIYHDSRGKLESYQVAEDAAALARGTSVDLAKNKLEKGLGQILCYAEKWKIRLNYQKTEVILFGRKRSLPHYRVSFQQSVTYVGVIIDRCLSFNQYLSRRCGLADFRLQNLYHLIRSTSDLSLRKKLPRSRQSFMVCRSEFKVLHSPPPRRLENTTRFFAAPKGALGLSESATCSQDPKLENLLTLAERRRQEMITRLKISKEWMKYSYHSDTVTLGYI